MEIPHFDIDISAFRPGQRQATDTIVDRIRRGCKHTAIVLPTRYGKTDVMRVAGLWLWRDKLVSRAMIMAPDKILRDQCVRGDLWDKALKRYHIQYPFPGGMPVYRVDRRPQLPFPPQSAIFVAITTQMANFHKVFLAQWIDHERETSGVPPVIFIDEAHTGSEANDWGESVEVLADAGAFVVLLTATPYRADKKRIPGFEDILVPEKTTPVTVAKRRVDDTGEILVDIYEGEREFYRLDAHHVTTFRQAWDEESPSPLCKITRRTFDVDLTKLDFNTGEVADKMLSGLNERDTRRTLMPALKDVTIIRQSCEILVEELGSRRRDAETTAAIVFVGNDEQSDFEVNQHARNVQEALRNLNPGLETLIATSSDADAAAETVGRFISGQGDVLIVKQMAGRGLDIDRLKVCLDLSNIRTPAAFVQRMTRICTIWDRNLNPDDVVRTAVYIAPDDCLGTALFQKFIIDQGGEASITDLTYVRTVPASDTTPDPLPVYIPQDVALPETIGDTQQQEAPGETIPAVEHIFRFLPELTRTRTYPEMANVMEEAGIRVERESGPSVRDINQEEDEAITRVNAIAKQLINRTVRESLGRSYRPGDREAAKVYGQVSTKVWTRHKQLVGVHPRVDVNDIHNIPTLDKMRLNMWGEYYG